MNRIKPKRSYTANSVPLTTDLEVNELAIRWTADSPAMFTKNAAGQIVTVSLSGGSGGGSSSLVTAATVAGFPATGSTANLYATTDTNRIYRWDATNSIYVELGPLAATGGDTLLRSYLVPTAPSNVTGTAGNAQVSLTWTAATSLSQIPITDYLIQSSTDNGTTWTLASDTVSAATSATITGLTNGTAYRFRVAGVNGVGTGAYSTASSAVTPAAAPIPQTITGLQLWLDASDASTLYDATSGGSLVAADGAVARWEDKSGNARHFTQSDVSRRPLRKTAVQNSKDVIRLDGSNDYMVGGDYMDLAGTQGMTLFIVVKRAAQGVPHDLLNKYARQEATTSGQNGNQGFIWAYDNTNKPYAYFGDSGSGVTVRGTDSAYGASSFTALTLKTRSGSLTTNTAHYVNGGAAASTNSSATCETVGDSAFEWRLGISRFDGSFYTPLNGDVAEVIMYGSALSDADRAAVETYLMQKWAIA